MWCPACARVLLTRSVLVVIGCDLGTACHHCCAKAVVRRHCLQADRVRRFCASATGRLVCLGRAVLHLGEMSEPDRGNRVTPCRVKVRGAACRPVRLYIGIDALADGGARADSGQVDAARAAPRCRTGGGCGCYGRGPSHTVMNACKGVVTIGCVAGCTEVARLCAGYVQRGEGKPIAARLLFTS